MAERIAVSDSAIGKDDGTSQANEEPNGHDRVGVLEHWLQKYLRQAFDDVSNEPMPSELSDLVDRLRANRQDSDDIHEDGAHGPRTLQNKS